MIEVLPTPEPPQTQLMRRGLSEAEAAARLRLGGFNELPHPEDRTPLRILLEVLREPMLALLLVGGAIYLVLGDLREALILIVFAALSVVITVIQEARTEHVLEALRDLTSPRALVIRDGERRRIAGREVVQGDLIALAEGDRVAADAVLLESQNLLADESLLTGESVPVRKLAVAGSPPAGARPGGDDLPYVYSGTLVVRGSGIGEVTATGPRSEIGRIGQSLHELETEPPRLRVQTQQLVTLSALGTAIVITLAVALYGVFRGNWIDALLAGITLGMAMLPEEFPVVLAVFMAMGAWRISRASVLTRRAAAIEALGSTTVLCTDKTGTLTQNRMSIAELRRPDGAARRLDRSAGDALAPPFADLVRFGVLSSAREPFDPMDRAFHDIAGARPGEALAVAGGLSLTHSYPLSPDLLALTQVWRDRRQQVATVAAKGAPEAIARLCRLSAEDFETTRRLVDGMATEGLRVLGIARAFHSSGELPVSPTSFDFEFLGLVGLADPLRPSVPVAVAECRSAGIRVLMITGDYPATARAIAREAGLRAGDVLTGRDVETLDDAELRRRLQAVDVFARIMPEQKLRLVEAFKGMGEIVAMTGDGVNDAPSLKAAHIGVAMGGRGTDVAREAADIVLLDDDFSSIVKAVRLGRLIYDNLRKAMSFIVAVHVPIAGLALLPLVFGLPIVFGPIHIAFLEMIIDPVCALAFEAETEESDLMRRPPRQPSEPLFTWPLIGWSVLQGALTFALVATIYLVALGRGMPEPELRALTFFALVFAVVGLILVNRSFSASLLAALRRPNPWLAWILLAVLAILAVAVSLPAIRSLFRFGPLHADDLVLTVGVGLFVLPMLEALKAVLRTRLRF